MCHAEGSRGLRPAATSTGRSKAFPGSFSRLTGKAGAGPRSPVVWLGASSGTQCDPGIYRRDLQGAWVSVAKLLRRKRWGGWWQASYMFFLHVTLALFPLRGVCIPFLDSGWACDSGP